MTREEAIEVIRQDGISYIPRNTEIFTAVDAAWTIAIRSLEAWDVIIEELEDIISNSDDSEEFKDGCTEALEIINIHLNDIANS